MQSIMICNPQKKIIKLLNKAGKIMKSTKISDLAELIKVFREVQDSRKMTILKM